MENEIYIVIAYRYGQREKHSYTLGAFDHIHAAIECADSHTAYRGAKYSCAVEKCVMNQCNNDADDYTIEVYRTKSAMCGKSVCEHQWMNSGLNVQGKSLKVCLKCNSTEQTVF